MLYIWYTVAGSKLDNIWQFYIRSEIRTILWTCYYFYFCSFL